MTARPPSTPTSRGWWSVESLGEVADASPLLAGWLAALLATPGDWLVLEQGTERGGAPFLRVQARPEVVGTRRGGPAGTPVRLTGLGPSPPPPSPWPTHVAYGRVLWTGGTELPGTTRAIAHPIAPPFPGPLGIEPGGIVQAVVLASRASGWEVHVRVAGLGPGHLAQTSRDRTGQRWAALLGGRYEPWEAGSPAHRVAHLEWTARSVVRFHSGPGLVPSLEVLARPWSIPPNRDPAAGSPFPPAATSPAAPAPEGPGLLLGWSWESGACRRLALPRLLRHMAIVGMTGSGKTQFLAHLAAASALEGLPFVLFDLHGDLGPNALSRLPEQARRQVVVMDATRTLEAGIVGIDVLGPRPRDPQRPLSDLELDRRASEVLSALRPLGGGSEEYWGPRMERFLEGGIRGALESRGTLLEVANLLQDPVSWAAGMALHARSPALRRFLSELPGLARRQPDLLSSSQNRLSKVLLSRTVQALVAPPREGLDLEALLEGPESLVVHLPKGSLGESSALFVANLVLARTFLAVLRGRPSPESWRPRRLLLLDEAQGFSPRLLRSLVEEGRKFGCACVFATQSPARLEEVLARSPTDAVGTIVALRLPPADAQRIAPTLLPVPGAPRGTGSAREAGRPDVLAGGLTTLPAHAAWVRLEGSSEAELLRLPPAFPSDALLWGRAAEAAARRFTGSSAPIQSLEGGDLTAPQRALLLRVFEAEAMDAPLDLARKGEGPGACLDPATSPSTLSLLLPLALERGWVSAGHGEDGRSRWKLTPGGWHALGYREDSGAPKESGEHRRLVFEAFRLFARNRVVLELPTQGDLEHKTPDARVLLLPERHRRMSPHELEQAIAERRATWLWRLGRGKDIHLEAEVSGADRSETLRNSWEKARRAHAFLLFVVGTPERGARVRRFLRQEGILPDAAAVWVLRPGVGERAHPYRPGVASPDPCRAREGSAV